MYMLLWFTRIQTTGICPKHNLKFYKSSITHMLLQYGPIWSSWTEKVQIQKYTNPHLLLQYLFSFQGLGKKIRLQSRQIIGIGARAFLFVFCNLKCCSKQASTTYSRLVQTPESVFLKSEIYATVCFDPLLWNPQCG